MGPYEILTVLFLLCLPSLHTTETESNLTKVFTYIDKNKDTWKQNLKEAVAIPSVSCSPRTIQNGFLMVQWAKEKLESCGFEVKRFPLGNTTLHGKSVMLPDLLCGTLRYDSNNETVLFYNHLDVQPARQSDGWDTEPFELTEKDGNLFGRGATDDKGPMVAWLAAIESFNKTGTHLPVNLKCMFECTEECGSYGLEEAVLAMKDDFLKDVSAVTISDTYWLGTEIPCLTYGLRGIIYFFVEVIGYKKDLHSGNFGGVVYEPLRDLIELLCQLTDSRGNILVPGIMNDCIPPTAEEMESYEKLTFDFKELEMEIGGNLKFLNNKTGFFNARWSRPTLSYHGIEGGFSEPGAKTAIPAKVIGKFSMRLVPNQDPEKVAKQVTKYLEYIWKKINSPNKMNITFGLEHKAWVADHHHPNFIAAGKAIERVYNITPELTREGGTIPVVKMIETSLNKNVLLLPMGQSDDGAHSQNEKFSIRNFICGIKIVAAYFFELAKVTNTF